MGVNQTYADKGSSIAILLLYILGYMPIMSSL